MSDEAGTSAPVQGNAAYTHSLAGHGVQGDGTFEEVNARAGHDHKEAALPEIRAFAEAAAASEGRDYKKAADAPLEPLPEIPPMPMTIDQAYEFLQVAKEDRGNLDKVKMRFRKMSLKWHPDKNMNREKEAAEVFRAVHAAYHFLTTNNFDYKRWAEAFVIPPMQTLEDVLMMALKGADPYQIEILLKRRGDYRPHADFGVNLSVPWTAGSKEDPNWGVADRSAYTTTQGIEDKRRAEIAYRPEDHVAPLAGAMVVAQQQADTQELLKTFGTKAQVGNDAQARPWETVGGTGFGAPKQQKTTYKAPETRPDLTAKSKEAKPVAEEFNDRAVKAFKAKEWQGCYDLSSEAIRLNPKKTAYLGNRAAAALKIGGRKYLRSAAEDSVLAYELDPAYTKAYARAAEAHMGIDERASVKLACQEYEKCVELEPDSKKYKEALKDAQLTWEADYA